MEGINACQGWLSRWGGNAWKTVSTSSGTVCAQLTLVSFIVYFGWRKKKGIVKYSPAVCWTEMGSMYSSTCPCSHASSLGRLQVSILHRVGFCTTFIKKARDHILHAFRFHAKLFWGGTNWVFQIFLLQIRTSDTVGVESRCPRWRKEDI